MKHMSMQIDDDDDDDEKPASVHTDLNFMSKRKVPNGPDPIHNRYLYYMQFLVYILLSCHPGMP